MATGDGVCPMGGGRGIKTLVVDDDPSVCDTLQMILEADGYGVQTCLGAPQALEACGRNSFDIALVDVKMPQVSGTELLKRLRKVDPRLGVIIMTAYPDVVSAAEAMRDGGRDYLTKPFTQQQLLAAVRRLCSQLGLTYADEPQLYSLVGQRIRRYRQDRKMTLRQLSARSGLTASQLSQIELGKCAASLWSLARISAALGLKLSDLLDGL